MLLLIIPFWRKSEVNCLLLSILSHIAAELQVAVIHPLPNMNSADLVQFKLGKSLAPQCIQRDLIFFSLRDAPSVSHWLLSVNWRSKDKLGLSFKSRSMMFICYRAHHWGISGYLLTTGALQHPELDYFVPISRAWNRHWFFFTESSCFPILILFSFFKGGVFTKN